MKEIKQYLNLEDDYDVNFVNFLIESGKAMIESYCNQPIFTQSKVLSLFISNQKTLLPYNYISDVTKLMDGTQELSFDYINNHILHWIETYERGFFDIYVEAGFKELPKDIILVLAEIVQTNYNQSRNNLLGIESKTVSLGAENAVTKYLDLTAKHKLMLKRYTKITI